MEDRQTECSEVDSRNLSDDTESESCGSSCCSDSDSEKLPWLDNVKSDGSLFYIEYDADLEPFLEDSINHSYPVEFESYKKQSKSKLNAAGKIKQWMKNRKKKARKSFPLQKSHANDMDLSSFSSTDTFPHYQYKDILIDVNSSKFTENCKFSLSEKLLGLKLGSLEENYSLCDTPCVIGILSNDDIPDIKIGDWLKSIDDIDVNLNNIEDILKEISPSSKVKLRIISQVNQINTRSHFLPSKHVNLIKELIGEPNAMQYAKLQCQNVPHGLFYLSIENGSFENEDVIYKYPDSHSALFQLKGMFLTLGHMISDVASPPLLSCSVMIQEDIVHIGFVKEESDIMLLALPASVATIAEVQHFSSGLAKLLKYQFSSLQKTFIMENDNYLDNFLTLYFKHYLSSLYCTPGVFTEPHLLDILPSAHWLPLPNDLKTEIDDIMSELESSDFGSDSDGFYGNRRIYNIFGSCLFYKGYLLCSHLPKNDLLDIHLFLHYNHILELTRMQPISQIIIWKEVFPSRHQEHPNLNPEFEECHGRWFMLIVAMQHSILAVLLDDGGCALNVEGNPVPEPFYVEEVQNTLFILQDCGITTATEKLLYFSLFPIVSSDLFSKEYSHNSLSSVFASNVSIHSSGQNMSSDHSTSHSNLIAEKEGIQKMLKCSSVDKIEEAKRQQLLSSIGPADGESDTESSYSNDSNDMDSFENRFRSHSVSTGSTTKSQASSECSQVDRDFENGLMQQSSSSLPNLSETVYSSEDISFTNSCRMVTDIGNNLFYYLHMDPVEGVFIAPVMSESSSIRSVQNSILDNFQRCSLNMRAVFERSLRNGEITKANIKTKYGINTFLQNAYEQGVLFHQNPVDPVKQKNSTQPEYFWVLGRLFFSPEPREVYVCCHDSTPQDIVEMAFRLGFGLSF